VAIVTNLIVSY